MILCVDDDARFLAELRSYMAGDNAIAVETISRPDLVVDYLHEHPETDVVVSEIMTIGVSGWNLLERVKREFPLVSVMLYSGNPICLNKQPGVTADPDLILQKPFKMREFIDALNTLIGRYYEHTRCRRRTSGPHILRRLLKRRGFKDVDICADGSEAIELIRNNDYDVVLLDILMPGVDGLQVLEATKPYKPRTEFIILTAVDDIATAVKTVRLGATIIWPNLWITKDCSYPSKEPSNEKDYGRRIRKRFPGPFPPMLWDPSMISSPNVPGSRNCFPSPR